MNVTNKLSEYIELKERLASHEDDFKASQRLKLMLKIREIEDALKKEGEGVLDSYVVKYEVDCGEFVNILERYRGKDLEEANRYFDELCLDEKIENVHLYEVRLLQSKNRVV